MGAVDLVIQVESPKSVARGLQRIGRSGHGVGDEQGPDLPEVPRRPARVRGRRPADARGGDRADGRAAQRARRARAADRRDRRRAPRRVAVDELFALVTRTHSYSELRRELLENVLDMLDGRYPSSEFGELRPRITWDRIAGTIRARKGAQKLAVVNAGTIPDRGLFVVTLPDGRRVGELDEEMVYEARPGQTFLLGATAWRIEEIGRDRVIVTPAPGRAGAVPFWQRGLASGARRSSARRSARSRAGRSTSPPRLLERDYDLDPLAARNLLEYLREQQAATGVLPSDRTIVVERFRDEIGDWRLCVLSPFGGRVHAAWGLALSRAHPRALRARVRRDLVRRRDHRPPPRHRRAAERRARPARARRDRGAGRRRARRLGAVRRALSRERRAGAADPARLPGQAHAAVAAAPEGADAARGRAALPATSRSSSRPTASACATCSTSPGCEELLRALARREISLVEVETPTASPFASSLLFDYVATYMYEGDAPNAERRAAALSLDRELLRELLGQEELRELIDAGALEALEADLQRRSRALRATSRDELHDVLRTLGDLTAAAGPRARARRARRRRDARRAACASAAPSRCGSRASGAGSPPQDAGLYRDALGVVPPSGLPDAFLEDVPDALRALAARHARSNGPFTTAELRARYGVDRRARCASSRPPATLVRGELRRFAPARARRRARVV